MMSFEKTTISNSYKLLFRENESHQYSVYLKNDEMGWTQIDLSSIVGFPPKSHNLKRYIDSCYARVVELDYGFKIYFEGRIRGGSKIPCVD